MQKEIKILNKTVTIETGKLAKSATSSVLVSQGNTQVLCTVCVSKEPESFMGFANLRVVYQEHSQAFGKIPGGYFKRNGKPTERETLVSRLIDRPIRPMIPVSYTNEIQVICSTLCYDNVNDPAPIAIVGATAAIVAAGVPLKSPVVSIRFAMDDNRNIIANPTVQELKSSTIYGIAGIGRSGIVMIEMQSKNATKHDIINILNKLSEGSQEALDIIDSFKPSSLNNKSALASKIEHYKDLIRDKYKPQIVSASSIQSKPERSEAMDAIISKACEINIDDAPIIESLINEELNSAFTDNIFQSSIRLDGRKTTDLRDIHAETNLFECGPHGSALFARGGTQVLTSTVLGDATDEQSIEFLGQDRKDRFMLHYNFPPFSVGELGRLGPPGRREIGHGALAKKAITAVMPNNFKYTVRAVADVLESDGSSSMATVCSTSLSLMSAGVPIDEHVSGIAMGIVSNGSSSLILTDISGTEDGFSGMDCKIAGTRNGITAMQMDIKYEGIGIADIEKAIDQSHDPRMEILDIMYNTIDKANAIPSNAPIMKTIKIDAAKIKKLIGVGGSNIKGICQKSDAKIDIQSNGSISISCSSQEGISLAEALIMDSVRDLSDGEMYSGTIVNKMSNNNLKISFMNNKQFGIAIDKNGKYNVGDSVQVILKKRSKKPPYQHQLTIKS